MPLKRLKVSMIFGGSYHTFGSVLEESDIPSNLRKSKYLQEPTAEALLEEEEIFEENEDLEISEEDLEPPPPPPKKKR